MPRPIATLCTALACASLVACAPAPAAAELTGAERSELERAEGLLVQRCMARQGFRYWPAPPLTADERRGSGYVLSDPGWAREHGYGGRLARRAAAAKKDDPNLPYFAGLSEERRARYNAAFEGERDVLRLTAGLPSGGTISGTFGGCTGEAKRLLFGDLGTWFRAGKIAMNLMPLYVPDLLADRRFVAAQRDWSRCMARQGHSYADPPEIRQALARLTDGMDATRAHAVEVRLAVAEATCARQTSFADLARSLERRYRERAARPYARELADLGHLEREALERARRTLSSGA
ncbi:hypothetical protein [Nonomuraea sp. NPDC050643]|uniref:hypothetical protein n=1 Tax=Nonomuraea sp. NPDC050643 TaxID=3155660 RepID=UPI0033C3CB40